MNAEDRLPNRADDLRTALVYFTTAEGYEDNWPTRQVVDAARERLAQLEPDPELVERIARRLHDFAPRERPVVRWSNLGEWQEGYRVDARLILAAITSAEETSGP